MPVPLNEELLDVLLDSWDRNNRILVNLLLTVPDTALYVRAMPSSPTVAEQFNHIHFVRLVFLTEDVPAFALPLPASEWLHISNRDQLALSLEESATAVRRGVENCILSGKPMQTNYDHPVLFLQHMIFHEGYHHGQIKLALKLAGHTLDDHKLGPLTWGLFIDKSA